MLEDRKTFTVAGQPRELFMSFANLTMACSVVGGLDALAESLMNPDIVLVVLAQLMRPDIDTPINTVQDAQIVMQGVSLSASEGQDVLAWVEQHIINFTLARANSLDNLSTTLQKALLELIPTSTGQQA